MSARPAASLKKGGGAGPGPVGKATERIGNANAQEAVDDYCLVLPSSLFARRILVPSSAFPGSKPSIFISAAQECVRILCLIVGRYYPRIVLAADPIRHL